MPGDAREPAARATTTHIVVIVAFGLLAHATLLMTDYLLWDGWLYDHELSRAEGPTHLRQLVGAAGRPLDMLFYTPLRWFSDKVFVSKALSVVCWVGSSVLMYDVLLRLARVPAAVCLAAGVLTVTSPAFPLLGELSLWMYVACIFLFWLAWSLVARLPTVQGVSRAALRITAVCVFLLSFNLNSLLVMFYAVALFLCAARMQQMDLRSAASCLTRAAARYPDLAVLPVAFWIWKTTCTPTHGLHAGYNQPTLDPTLLASGYATMVVHFLVASTIGLVTAPYALPLFAVSLAIFSTRRVRSWVSWTCTMSRNSAVWLVAWGLFLLTAAAFPYIVVGQHLVGTGWLSRNCVLCLLPIALILIGTLIAINRGALPGRPDAWQPFVFALAAVMVMACVENYLLFQGYGAKELALQRSLRAAIEEHRPCAVQLRDNLHVRGALPYYPPIVWTYLAAEGQSPLRTFVIETSTMVPDQVTTTPWGERRRMPGAFAIDSKSLDDMIVATLVPYAMTDIPRTGPHVVVNCDAGRDVMDGRGLGLSYLYYRWLRPAEKARFLDSLVTCTVARLPPVAAR